MSQKVELVKNKLLSIARTGIFTKFSPVQIDEIYNELKQVLIDTDSIEVNELFELYELHVYLSLITSHETEAKTYIDRIIDQFGEDNSQRITLLKALYFESTGASSKSANLLSKNPDETRLSRRLITFNRKASSNEEYIKNLNLYLNIQPSDLIAWAELADEYASIGHYDKAIFCLQEILLQEPLSFNIFYKVGLFNYYLYLQNFSKDINKKEKIVDSMHYLKSARDNWLRTIEICKDHKKSWLGLYIINNLSHFNEKLDKISSSKEVLEYKRDTDKLRKLCNAKVEQLGIDVKQLEI